MFMTFYNNRTMKTLILFLVAILFLSVCPMWSQEEEKVNPLTEDRFLIEAGVYGVTRSFRLGADGESNNGEIDFNEAFDLTDNKPTFFFQATWRFSKTRKWAVAFESFGVNAGNSVTLDEDIDFESIDNELF